MLIEFGNQSDVSQFCESDADGSHVDRAHVSILAAILTRWRTARSGLISHARSGALGRLHLFGQLWGSHDASHDQ